MPQLFHRRILLQRAMQASACIVGMPILECMLNTNGTAYANGLGLETFYGTFFMGNGKAKNTWVPTNSNGNADPRWNCANGDPLKAIINNNCKSEISIVTGLNAPKLRNGPHKHSQSLSLSGGVGTRDGNKSYADATIDQIVAEHYNSESMVASCCRIVSGNANNLEKFISWQKQDVPNSPILDPKQLFQSIFSSGNTGNTNANTSSTMKTSILDHVTQDIQTLKNQGLSRTDQRRLDEHLDAIRSLERQLQDSPPTNNQMDTQLLSQDIDELYPNGLGIRSTNGAVRLSNTHEQINARWNILIQIIALALSGHKRAAFALAFTHPGDQTPLPGQIHFPTRGVHSLAHTANAKAQQDLNRVTYYQVERYCQLVNALKEHRDVTGNRVIDRAMVLCTSELDHGYGTAHVHDDIPMLLAGSANGAFKTGVHVNANGKQVGNAGLTALQAVLGEQADFRTSSGHIGKPDEPISELFTS